MEQDNKPNSMPEWMWMEWIELRKSQAAEDYLQDIEFIQKIVAARECSCVWSAIEHRPRENHRAIFRHLLGSLYDFSVAEELADVVSPAEKRAKSVRIIAAVKELRAALKDVHSDKFGWPMEFAAALRTLPPNDDPHRLSVTLKGIVQAAKWWAAEAEPLIIKHVNAPNAKRLFFIRQVTNFFQTYFGSPLREQTAALTRIVFDCDMDAATVAKLAPLNKH